jgi:hypothetical protein
MYISMSFSRALFLCVALSGRTRMTNVTSVPPRTKHEMGFLLPPPFAAMRKQAVYCHFFPGSGSRGAHALANRIQDPSMRTGRTLGVPRPKSTCLKLRCAYTQRSSAPEVSSEADRSI